MVTIRDVSHVKKMEAIASEKEKELKIIGQLIGLKGHTFNQFRKDLDQALTTISGSDIVNEDLKLKVLRELHTLKGNARALGLTELSSAIHQLESDLLGEKSTNKSVQSTDESTRILTNMALEYDRVFHQILARSDSSSINEDGVWVNTQTLLQIKSQLPDCSDALEYIDIALSTPFDKLVEGNVQTALLIAEELHKAPPCFKLLTQGLRVKNAYKDEVLGIFTHMFRNAIDHGIETEELRKGRGKPANGHITVEMYLYDRYTVFTIYDDGQGLDLNKLRLIGLEKGNLTGSSSNEEIASSIFTPYNTTKASSTNISGRGIGLDASLAFAKKLDGYLVVELNKENKVGRYEFQLKLTLPNTVFVMEPSEDS